MKYRILFSILAAAVLTAMTALLGFPKWNGLLYRADNAASDSLFQQPCTPSRDITVIGIDQDTLAEFGPSLRAAMAQVIETLNADPADRPAVIGIDVMFQGENRDAPEADLRLAEAAALYDNVIIAADVKLGTEYVWTENGTFAVTEHLITDWYEPYSALNEAVSCGHVNQSLDRDGIFRHARLYADVPGSGRLSSFARVVYERWCIETGTDPLPAPETSSSGYCYLLFTQGVESSGISGYSDGISLLDLCRGGIDPDFYRGKIVLIGASYPGSGDEYFTSLDHTRKMPGVVIQANMIEAFRKGAFPREAGFGMQLMILFLLSALTAAFLWDRRIIPSVIGWLAVCGLWFGICLLARQSGVILHVLWVPACASVLFIGSVAVNYMWSRREQRRVTDTFGCYIDPAVRDQLLAGGQEALAPGGKTRRIAVLFVDVRGFTAMSEALDAQTVVEIINRYLTLTTDCIIKNHGTLDKFMGDCTMAIWNAPVEQKDPVFLACRAAMDMIAGSEALEKELREQFGRSVSFGIGIHWGPAVVGNIGAPKRLDYTAVGDTVNTAARLEELAPGGTILISRAAADQLGGRAELARPEGRMQLKGKTGDFEVLILKALADS